MNLEEAGCSWFPSHIELEHHDAGAPIATERLPDFAAHCLRHGVKAVCVTLDESGCAAYWLDESDNLVERINYDDSINDRLTVNAGLGNDRFFVDDNSAITTLDGGLGDDDFQIGQLFQTERDLAAGIAAGDVYADDTVETTAGFLTRGVSFATTVYGSEGADTFSVYRNEAPLRLEGGSGNDTFIVRAFALVDQTVTQQANTEIDGGDGADEIQYNVNAPVSIDGGDGFDKVVVVGTEFGDNFVINENGVFGAGLNVTTPRSRPWRWTASRATTSSSSRARTRTS
jgi:hypothetical protein